MSNDYELGYSLVLLLMKKPNWLKYMKHAY